MCVGHLLPVETASSTSLIIFMMKQELHIRALQALLILFCTFFNSLRTCVLRKNLSELYVVLFPQFERLKVFNRFKVNIWKNLILFRNVIYKIDCQNIYRLKANPRKLTYAI